MHRLLWLLWGAAIALSLVSIRVHRIPDGKAAITTFYEISNLRDLQKMKLTLSTRGYGIVSGALILIWGAISLYAVHAGMRRNPIRLPGEDWLNIQIFLPEGWRFFTKNAEEEEVLVYTPSSVGHWELAFRKTAADPAFLFGADRTGRYPLIEPALLIKQVKNEWAPCNEEPADCLAKPQPAASVTSKTPRPALCGIVGFVRQKPVPWAWSRWKGRVVMPSTFVKVDVKC
jgi:antimicrobial peptide system SdpA family protein